MSDFESSGKSSPKTTLTAATPAGETIQTTATQQPSLETQSECQAAIESLFHILTSIPPPHSSGTVLLHDPSISSQISTLLRHPDTGAGNHHLCRWLYDTFLSSIPELQLLVLRYIPLVAGVYVTRVTQVRPLAGFEAVLLAVYAHEATSRAGQAISVRIPDLSSPSIYHESNVPVENNATELNMAVISSRLEPHGTVRSTKRARIVGVALEVYFSKILLMPVGSKLDFCEFCEVWAGQDGDMYRGGRAAEGGRPRGGEGDGGGGEMVEGGRIPLPWELLRPCLRILGHCLMSGENKELYDKASGACRCLYARALHDLDPMAILAAGSLLKLMKMETSSDDFDTTEMAIVKHQTC
ncbi:hypothetical protein Nepgr_006369 [Nepenthes gracilis]|uniref:Hyccin n=1 Tax=Nepenthes gracilis TaxID=150966 RepID=A0AAD3XHA3_NEPGR|nr:hypothetical protein Nepgr_006369 [Nepenthes gracilis]